MKVEVRLFATLERFLPPHACHGVATLEVPDGSTVGDVTRSLGIPGDLARVVLVNGLDGSATQRLAPNDVLDVFPPLAGGSS